MDRELELICAINNELEEMEEVNYVFRLQRRYIRDMANPLEMYTDEEFKKRYRFSKLTFNNQLMPLLNDAFRKPTNQGLPFPPTICLAIALRFYATGSFQVNLFFEI